MIETRASARRDWRRVKTRKRGRPSGNVARASSSKKQIDCEKESLDAHRDDPGLGFNRQSSRSRRAEARLPFAQTRYRFPNCAAVGAYLPTPTTAASWRCSSWTQAHSGIQTSNASSALNTGHRVVEYHADGRPNWHESKQPRQVSTSSNASWAASHSSGSHRRRTRHRCQP